MTMHSSLRLRHGVVRTKGTPGQRRRSVRKRQIQREKQQALMAEAKALGISIGEVQRRRIAAVAHFFTPTRTFSAKTPAPVPEYHQTSSYGGYWR